MTKRLTILKNSLEKKNKLLDEKFETHFKTVKEANGQPLNDKRNGQATLNKWDRQSDSIRNLKDSIKKTQDAIDKENGKICDVDFIYGIMPECIKKLIDDGVIKQWRKHPHILFVTGVDKARIVWDSKKQIIMHSYTNRIPDDDQWKKFSAIFNNIKSIIK